MMKRKFTCFFISLLALAAAIPVNAISELTVFGDGDELSNTSPINLVYMDEVGTRCQVIFPAEALSEMNGEPINSMTFYLVAGRDRPIVFCRRLYYRWTCSGRHNINECWRENAGHQF